MTTSVDKLPRVASFDLPSMASGLLTKSLPLEFFSNFSISSGAGCVVGRIVAWLAVIVVIFSLFACGGGGSGGSIASPSAGISSQPSDVSVVQGNAANFSVIATGNGLSYQWQISLDLGVSWGNISGATSSSFNISSTLITDNGKRYRVVVTASNGSNVTSSAATLAVLAATVAPAITVQPASQSVVEPAPANFSVTATGTSLAYQWQSCGDSLPTCALWNDITNATTATFSLTTTSVATNNGQRYRVVVSNTAGSATSNAVTLSVSASSAPGFSAQPTNVSVTAPSVATFTVTITGSPVPTIQWQTSIDGGINWSNIAGATSSSFSTPATSVSDSGKRYRAIATNSVSVTTSNAATLTVNPTPVIPSFGTQPTSASVTEGQPAGFTVAVNGTPTPTVQWQLSSNSGSTWSNINGATALTFSIPSTTFSSNGTQYRAVASNTAGSANSNAATLTVVALPGKTWQAAALLENDNTGEAVTPQVAFNENGDGVAVWVQIDNSGKYTVRASRYSNVTGWTAPTIILNTAVPAIDIHDASKPQVVIDSSGVATVIWNEADSFFSNIWASRSSGGNAWSVPDLVDGPVIQSTFATREPRLAVDSNGVVMAVWQREAGSGVTVWSSRYTSSWDAPVQIGSGNPNVTDTLPRIAMDAAGNAFVVWKQYENGVSNLPIYANVFRIAGGWVGEGRISDAASAAQYQSVTTCGNGNAFAVWTDQATGVNTIWANRYVVGTGWTTPAIIQSTTAAHQSFVPQVACDSLGNAIAVWQQFDGTTSTTNIYANRYVAGAGWGQDTLLETSNTINASNPQIDMDGSGNAIAVWGQGAIFYNKYVSGTGWGSAVTVEPSNPQGGNAVFPQVSVNSGGSALVVWQRDGGFGSGTVFSVWANSYR